MNLFKNDKVTYYAWSRPDNKLPFKTFDDAVNQALKYAKNGASKVWIDVRVINPEGNSGFYSGVATLKDDTLEIIKKYYTNLDKEVKKL